MRKLIAVAALGALVALPQAAFAAGDTATQSVKISVPAINEIAVTGGVVEIAIDIPAAGSDTEAKTVTGGSIAFTTNEESKKIHAQLSAALLNPKMKLYVKETAAEDTAYVDLAAGGDVKDISKGFDAVPITYKLEAPVDAGKLDETTVTVVYTIQ